MNKKTLMFWLGMTLCLTSNLLAGDDAVSYSNARYFIRTGSPEFAIMQYRNIVRGSANSRWRETALFAIGEYYFAQFDYREARPLLEQFCREYPNSPNKIFALSYRLKIAQTRQADELVIQELEKEIIRIKQVGLIFKDFKEYEYTSPFHKHYRAVFHIEKIEVFLQGELLAQVSY